MSDVGERVAVQEAAGKASAWEVTLDGSTLARLYTHASKSADGVESSTARLHFDGEVRPDTMAAVMDKVRAQVLASLPRGICVVYRGHLFSSFEYGGGAR